MATILDVAKAAGVSQGTVSNVLNGKGNVSSEKIRLVQEAAKKLGYRMNKSAKLLRTGSSKSLAVILPSLRFREYLDFYSSFRNYAKNNGYKVILYNTHDNEYDEKKILKEIKSEMIHGIATFTALGKKGKLYEDNDFYCSNIIYAERIPEGIDSFQYVGFDYEGAGRSIGERVLKNGHKSICLFTNELNLSNEKAFYNGFSEAILKDESCILEHIHTDTAAYTKNSTLLLETKKPLDCIVTSHLTLAETARDMINTLGNGTQIPIYTLSPIYSMPENKYQKYELNYHLLGKTAAERLIKGEEFSEKINLNILENDGFRSWVPSNVGSDNRDKKLRIITIDSPHAQALKNMAKLYTNATGVDVQISVFSYDSLFDTFSNMGQANIFDIIRIDNTWLSYFAEKLFIPLEEIDPEVKSMFSEFLPSLPENYSMFNNKIYALPETPSAQLLFYRKDLFENIGIKRAYKERYKQELEPPVDYKSFNQIAEFFTRKYNPDSPVEYGTTLTLGNTGVTATEFLARYFSYRKNLNRVNGKIKINDDSGKKALSDLLACKDFISENKHKWWTDSAREFSSGNVAMSIIFSNYASEIIGYDSKIIHNIGYAMVPGGNPIIGGGSLGISKNCGNVEEAYSFIKWVCSEPIASALTALGSVSPDKKTYDHYDIIDAFPWLEIAKDCFPKSYTARNPKNKNARFNERRFLSILGTAIINVINEVMSIDEALDYAQLSLEEL
ncbi:extracellular solute-binding protein [Alloiococcus sp. CFN-8]|uniref:extracellular solute-binding protein n=1 Tax=Alloiococcus sp. CFN-8 TaxID=3416081 RepID=UPI003CF9D2D8